MKILKFYREIYQNRHLFIEIRVILDSILNLNFKIHIPPQIIIIFFRNLILKTQNQTI